MPNLLKMGDFDLTVESIVLVHRCTFEYGSNISDYRTGRGTARACSVPVGKRQV